MNAPFFTASLIIMLIGLAGTVLPILPGIALIYAGYLVYGVFTSWHQYGAWTMIFWGAVTGVTLVLDYWAPAFGARRSGSSILGIWGSFIGAAIGLILFGLPGLIVGTFAGAVAGELMAHRPIAEALKSGRGALVGFVAGSLLRVVVGLVMVGAFIWQVAIR